MLEDSRYVPKKYSDIIFRFTGPPGAPHHQDNVLKEKFQKVATFHMISLVVTLLPYTTFNLALYLMKVRIFPQYFPYASSKLSGI